MVKKKVKKKRPALKKEKIDLWGGITIKKGGLHRSLGIPQDKKIGKPTINRLSKVKIGSMFDVRGKKKKMTTKIKRQVGLAKAFQGMRKRKKKK